MLGFCVTGKEDKVEEPKPFLSSLLLFLSPGVGVGNLDARRGYKEMSIYFGDLTPYLTYGGSPPSRM